MAGLKDGVVIDVPAWKVPVISKKKLIKQPEIAVDIKFSTEDVKEMPDKQFKVFEQTFEKRFTPEFNKMSNGWFAEMQKVLDNSEDAVEKLAKDKNAKGDVKKLMEELVAKANAVLAKRCKDWVELARKLAEKAYTEAYDASLKAMKLKIVKARAKVAVKIALVVLLTLTAAAVTIAVSVVTMGAGAAVAPVVIAALATGTKALLGSASEILKSYDVLGNTLTAVEKDMANLEKANESISKARQKTAGTWDKVKAFKAYMEADVTALDKHVGQLDKFTAVARDKSLKQIKELQGLADQLAKAKDGSPEAAKLEKEVLSTQKSIDSAFKTLDTIGDLKTEVAKVKAAAAKSDPDAIFVALPKLRPVVTKLKAAVDFGKKVGGPLKTIATGVKKIVDAASKK
ncbi:hypothetical protein LXT12_25335 [Pelomonas sp. P7]|uniref:Uncharacterized protein n=1 Tax=Pelomonas caseinilytica TaxID=2906763 RepID=A0ABS8XPK1_9BURK|nr:hypothetical protein [Pelomonas sp. P7]MCE4540569.1 hypothetical protein [Pelomonas sp. P7]